MCLTIIGHVLSMEGQSGVCEVNGEKIQVNFMLLPEVAVGDHVMLQASFAVHKFTQQELDDFWSVFKTDDTNGSEIAGG